MMTLSVTAKSRSFTNGTTEDATPVDASFTELYNNDGTIASYINNYCVLNNGVNVFSAIQTFNAGLNPAISTNPISPAVGLFWYSSTSNAFQGAVQVATVATASNATPIAITTSTPHGLLAGQSVIISGILGNTAANGVFTITVTSATTFTLNGSTGNAAYVSGGVVVLIQTIASTLGLNQYHIGFHGSAVPQATISSGSGSGSVTVSSSSTTITFSTSQTNLTGSIILTNGGQSRVIVSGSGTSWTVNVIFDSSESAVSWSYTKCTGLSMAFIHERDSTNSMNLDNSSACNISLNTTGLGGLDTGSIAANTFYYLYVVSNGFNVGLMISTVNESVSGSISNANFAYTYKRQLPFWLLTNPGGINLWPFTIDEGWPYQPKILYNVYLSYYTGTASSPTLHLGATNVLNGGAATTEISVSTTSFIPPICGKAFLHCVGYNLGFLSLRPTGSLIGRGRQYGATTNTNTVYEVFPAEVNINSSQSFDYEQASSGTAVYIDVIGATVTGI